MSTKLVRRLLQQTAHFDTSPSNDGHDGTNNGTTKHTQKPLSKKKSTHQNKNRQQQQQLNADPVGPEKVLHQQVKSLLFMDKAMASKSFDKKHLTNQRIQKQHSAQKVARTAASKLLLGNTRSSSSRDSMPKAHIPTFNKKRYKKQQEEKNLAQIAKLLAKQQQRRQKSKSQKKAQSSSQK